MIKRTLLNGSAGIVLIALLLLVLMVGCSSQRRSRIDPPLTELDIPFQKFQFHADSGLTVRLATGTTIRIDPGSLVDAEGKSAKGKIEFRVREFHTTNDILRAGIPLSTQANGSERLQSAGMIEMRAYSNGQALEVASGKTIGVDLAGYRNSTGYDLWYMEGDDRWDVRGDFRSDSNRSKIETIQTLKDSLKKPRSPMEEEDRTFELVGNISEIPYLRPYVGMKWRLDDSESIEVLGVQGRVHWENVRINKVKNREQVFALTFTQFDRGDEGSNKGIQKTILASPMTTRNDMKNRMAIYEKELAEIERRERDRLEALARAKQEADLIQSFKADRLGIWNIDRFQKMEDCVPVYVHFDFERSIQSSDKPIRLFALYDGDNSVMEYKPEEWKAVFLQKGKPMRLIAVLPNNQLALVGNENIQSALRQGKNEVIFETKKIPSTEFLKTATP
jgi:uncharacterized protein YifN (PemK superfamily)